MKKYHTIYQITNLTNGMIYIGKHSTDNIEDNYLGSGKRIKEEIKKIGRQHFEKKILFDFDNPEDMILKEKELLSEDFCRRDDTYNLSIGSNGWGMLDKKLEPRSDEYRKKMSIAKKGKKLPPLRPEVREKVILTLVPGAFKGMQHSEETKQKMSNDRKGEGNAMFGKKKTQESIERSRRGNIGRKASAETRQKMSEAKKGKPLGPQSPEHTEKVRLKNLGRKKGPHSEEHKEKLRQAKIGKPRTEEVKEKIRQTNLRKSFDKKMNILNQIISNLIDLKLHNIQTRVT